MAEQRPTAHDRRQKRPKTEDRRPKLIWCVGVFWCAVVAPVQAQRRAPARAGQPAVAAPAYFPERFDWLHKSPAEEGMDSAGLAEAIRSAQANETRALKD